MNAISELLEIVNPQVKPRIWYVFTGIENLYADEKGNFFLNGILIEKQYRDRQVYITVNRVRYGMKTLRKLATKTNNSPCPF